METVSQFIHGTYIYQKEEEEEKISMNCEMGNNLKINCFVYVRFGLV